MTLLFEPKRHEPLNIHTWNEGEVSLIVEAIFDDGLSNFKNLKYQSIYLGRAGTLWGLLKISEYLNREIPFDVKQTSQKIHHDYLQTPDTKQVVPSLFLGEVGILLVNYFISPEMTIENKIFELVEGNIENPTLEALWGSPGTIIAASYFYNTTLNDRWKNLFIENATFLIKKLKEQEPDELIWLQDLYGKQVRYIGAGHGCFGNMYGILKSLNLLSNDAQDYITSHIQLVLEKLALEKNGLINWPALYLYSQGRDPLVQWCHGAPGIITSLKNYPQSSEDIESMLEKAGDLIWKAGPLTKGIGICHGIDGNGFALLQLYKRTGNEIWLERARAFAMHCLTQRKKEYSLFEGDMGLALFLIACLTKTDIFPFLDDF